MALWHFMNGADPVSWEENGMLVSSFDDGLDYIPGEALFNDGAATAKAAMLGVGVEPIYTGTPGYASRISAEAKAFQAAAAKALAEAQINAMLHPVDPRAAGINSQFDALLAAAPDRAEDIEKLRQQALDDLQQAHTSD